MRRSIRRSLRRLFVAGLLVLVPPLAGCPNEGEGHPDLSAPADFAAPPDLTDDPCILDGGCYGCPPVTVPQFLNQCTTASCAPFDNKARLPKLKADGTLPPLP